MRNNKNNNRRKEIWYPINDEIRFIGNVRVVGEGIESKVVSILEARSMAREMGLDLVEINGNIDTPIMKITNYEKLVYEMKRAAKKNKQNNKPLKEIQLSVNIGKHDLETKAKHAKSFLEDGHKVKVVLKMRGRELARREENKKPILEFIVMLEDVASIDGTLRDEGNKTTVYLKKKN